MCFRISAKGKFREYIIHEVQSILQEFKLLNSKPKAIISTNYKELEEIIFKEKEVICGLAKLSDISLKQENDKDVEGWLSSVVNERIDIFLDIKNKINLDNELKRLNKNLVDKEKYLNGLRNKIGKPDYIKRVREEIKNEDQHKLLTAETEIRKLKESISSLNKLKSK